MSHAAGVGAALPREVVRAMLLLRANTLALGHSGCRPLLVDRLLAFLALGIHPVVPEQGSVGASGDLAPLAHLALPLIGRGRVELNGHVRAGARRPPRGGSRAAGPRGEGGTRPPERHPADERDRGAAARRRRPPGAHRERGSGDQRRGASRHRRRVCRRLPAGPPAPRTGRRRSASCVTSSGTPRSRQRHKGDSHKVQDPYSLRCVPQVHGAVRDAFDHLRRVLDIEMNSATDNPLVFPEGGVVDEDALATGGGLVISGGNFHGEPIALALDFAKLALAELGSISERRTALLVDERLNGGLPAFLAPASGLDSGMMILQYTAAALASENKVLAHPASADSVPTSANQEDHVSMGSIAARHARTVLEHVEQILGDRADRGGPGARPASVARRGGWCRAWDRRRRGASADPRPDQPPRSGPRAGSGHCGRDRTSSGAAHSRRWPVPAVGARLACPSGSSTSPTSRPSDRSRRAPTRASITGRATTGRMRIAARRRLGSPGSTRRRPHRRSRGRPIHSPSMAPTSRSTTRLPRGRAPDRRSIPSRRTTTRSLKTRSPHRGRLGQRSGPTCRASSRFSVAASAIFGSYAKVLLVDDVAAAYAQFGPLSAYPRAQRLRDLYPQLPDAPLPAVITCIASTADGPSSRPRPATGRSRLRRSRRTRVRGGRGLSRTRRHGPTRRARRRRNSGSTVGFRVAVDDERFPVVRRELG